MLDLEGKDTRKKRERNGTPKTQRGKQLKGKDT
jgi:hypothetical protein